MKTFYLVRHGESEANRKGILAGWQDHPLSEKGLKQVAHMAERLKDYPIEAVFTSDLTRAVQTAEAICHEIHVTMTKTPDLREIYMGEWEGETFDRLDPNSEQVKSWLRQDMHFCYPGGESVKTVLDRSLAYFEKLLERPETHMVIVGHGMMLSVLMSHVIFKDYLLSYGFQLKNAGITIMHIDDGFRYISLLNG